MKNKKVTYFLLVLSIGLWGFIGWKIYGAFNQSTPEVPTVKKETAIVEKDSISLLLNYRDPFLGKYNQAATVKAATLSADREPTTAPPIQPKQEPTPPNVQYKGVMNAGKTSMAIVQNNDRVLTITVGEEVDGFKLTKIEDNKIVLSKERKRYEIPLQ